MKITQTHFVPMYNNADRCANCHAAMIDHHNGRCAPECDECGCVGTAGNEMQARDHEKSCSGALA
jgi:reverse gyrase